MSSNGKRPRGDDSNNSDESDEKKRKQDESDEKKRIQDISLELKKILGPTFGNPVFLEILQENPKFLKKTLEECAQWIIDTSGKNLHSLVEYVYSGSLQDLTKNSCLSEIFVILMNTYVMYYLVEHRSTDIKCFFDRKEVEVKITSSLIKNGNPFFLSEIYQLQLVNNGKSISYEATFQKNLRIREPNIGEIIFEPSDDASHPPVLLGKGSYGFVFKIMGIDGEWYIVKVFSNERSTKHEWSALDIVNGMHPCLQQGIEIQTGRQGDIKHIIVSKFQGDIVLSKVRSSIYRLNLQQIIWMFLDLSKGLMKVHELGIIHCDIKLDNIILSIGSLGKHVLTLIDFGIAENVGKETSDPQSHYTWWYRNQQLFLDSFMRGFNRINSTFVEPVKLSEVMDWGAFFITFLHVISNPSKDFLGFRARTEEGARNFMINTSPVAQLMLKMKPLLGGDKRNIDFVRAIYFVLFNEEGPEKFVQTFDSFGIKRTGTGMYDEYLKIFKELRKNHPSIPHVHKVFKYTRCEKLSLNISGPMNNLIGLFVDILRDGADLSLLGCLTMDHIHHWLDRLKESLRELCALNAKVFFY
jgi:hypothetical protein